MAITATTQVIEQGPRNYIVQWTGVSDGTGNENKVVKVDVSQLTPPCGSVKIMAIQGTVSFGIVELYWDALVPKKFAELADQIDTDYCKSGGLTNNAGIGKTGDILLSTVGFELNSTYNLYIEMVKKS